MSAPLPVEEMLRAHGALLSGHFALSSGLHSDRYLQCALVLARPARAEELGRALAARAAAPASLVVSPALGGLIIGQEVARALGLRHYFAERQEGVLRLRRGFRIEPGERILVVEDVVTTGKSTREVFDLVRAAGGLPIGALSVVDRSEGRAALGVPFEALWRVAVPAWEPAACPLCREGAPLQKPGSRTEKTNA